MEAIFAQVLISRFWLYFSVPRVFLVAGECGDDKSTHNEIEKGGKEKARNKFRTGGRDFWEGRRGLQKAGLTVQIYNGHGRCHELRTP